MRKCISYMKFIHMKIFRDFLKIPHHRKQENVREYCSLAIDIIQWLNFKRVENWKGLSKGEKLMFPFLFENLIYCNFSSLLIQIDKHASGLVSA